MHNEQRQTILLVDDRPQNLLLLINHLDHAGYNVLVADSGRVALERLQTIVPDLILLDVVMPELDGYETCHALKANELVANIPVLFLTNLNEPVDRIRGFQVGGVDYIIKPIEPNEVLARIRTHITLHQLQQQVESQNKLLQAQNIELGKHIQESQAKLSAEIHLRQQTQMESHSIRRLMQQQDSQLIELVMKVFSHKTDAPNLFQILCAPLQAQIIQSQEILDYLLSTVPAHSNPAKTELTVPLTQLQAIQTHLDTTLNHLEQFVSDEAAAEYGETAEKIAQLSERENEVFERLVNGDSVSNIAEHLSISEVTVRTYRTRIMSKLNVTHLPALIKTALQQGLTI